MLFKSEIVTQASGSIGGTTYSHNSSGMYRRARAIPVNPNSAAQQAVRANLSMLALSWGNVLTEDQRLAWGNYAALTPTTNKLGDPLILSGQQMYIRCNSTRMRGGLASVSDGPTIAGLTMLTPPVTTASAIGANISVAYTNTDQWANAVGGVLVIQSSRLLGPGINFFRTPFRFLMAEPGLAIPPTSPITSPTTAFGEPMSGASIGQKVAIRSVACDETGRISAVMTQLATITA